MQEYPVNLKIDYPESSDRLTAVFRLILVIPVVIILALISTYAEALSFAIAMMILFKEKYPKWWFDWNIGITKLHTESWLMFSSWEMSTRRRMMINLST